MELKKILGLRAQHQDSAVLDLMDLVVLAGDQMPFYVPPETLQARWGVSKSSVCHRLGSLKRAGLIRLDRGARGRPGYLIWQIGPREDL